MTPWCLCARLVAKRKLPGTLLSALVGQLNGRRSLPYASNRCYHLSHHYGPLSGKTTVVGGTMFAARRFGGKFKSAQTWYLEEKILLFTCMNLCDILEVTVHCAYSLLNLHSSCKFVYALRDTKYWTSRIWPPLISFNGRYRKREEFAKSICPSLQTTNTRTGSKFQRDLEVTSAGLPVN